MNWTLRIINSAPHVFIQEIYRDGVKFSTNETLAMTFKTVKNAIQCLEDLEDSGLYFKLVPEIKKADSN